MKALKVEEIRVGIDLRRSEVSFSLVRSWVLGAAYIYK